MSIVPLITMLAALGGFSGLLFSEDHAYSIQNPYLRGIFRQRCVALKSMTDNFGHRRFMGNPYVLELQVDRMVSDFIKALEKKSRRALRAMGESRTIWERIETASNHDASKLGKELRKSLRELATSARDLRKHLAMVMPDFEDRDDYSPGRRRAGSSEENDPALPLVFAHLESARRQIESFFFSAAHVVQIEDLTEHNLLLDLYHVEKEAQHLAGSF